MHGLQRWTPDTLPAVVVRDIPPPVYRLLQERATLHRRTLNAELLSILEGALGPRRLTAAEILSGVERLVAGGVERGPGQEQEQGRCRGGSTP